MFLNFPVGCGRPVISYETVKVVDPPNFFKSLQSQAVDLLTNLCVCVCVCVCWGVCVRECMYV